MRTKNLRRIAALAAVAAALPAATAQAALVETGACDDAALSQAFSRFGDPAQYKLVPGGDFEGAHGWKLSGGASTVSGSDPYALTGALGAASVRLPAGASVTAPATCVNAAYPTFRFVAKSAPSGLLGLLPVMKAEVLYRDSLLSIVALPAGVVTPSSSWSPTLSQLTSSALAGALSDGEEPVNIRLTAVFGTWTVDDVFVDPYYRH